MPFFQPRDLNDRGLVIGDYASSEAQNAGHGIAVNLRTGTTVDLSMPPDTTALPQVDAINNANEVVGHATVDGQAHAYLWRVGTGERRELPVPFNNVELISFSDLNDAGLAVGVVVLRRPPALPGDTAAQDGAVVWDTHRGTARLLPGGGTARGVNRSGLVVGEVADPEAPLAQHAARWDPDGTLHRLDEPPRTRGSIASAVNDVGDIVGYASTDRGSQLVRWDARTGAVNTLDVASGWGLEVAGVNNQRIVAGRLSLWSSSPPETPTGGPPSTLLNPLVQHAFRVDLATGHLDDLNGDNQDSYAAALNNTGTVLGVARAPGRLDPVVWEPERALGAC